jgi:hypothetical protein
MTSTHARSPLPYVLLTIVLFLAVGAVAVYAALLVGMVLCGGDGGSPYADPTSARWHACGFFTALMPWLVLGALGATFAGGVAAAGRRRAGIAWLTAGISAGATWLPVVILSNLSAT